jgi:hypothetical protein
MSSVASANPSTNPGLADVLNILSNSASPALSSLLSSTKVQSALQNASPADLVQLSDQALQLQAVDSLFGNPDASQTDGIFGDSPATIPTIGSTAAAPSVANQLAIYEGQLQAENTSALFGTAASGNSVNVLG